MTSIIRLENFEVDESEEARELAIALTDDMEAVPEGYIRRMVEVHPRLVRVLLSPWHNHYALAIHLACGNCHGSETAIIDLVKVFPQSVLVRDEDGDLPIEIYLQSRTVQEEMNPFPRVETVKVLVEAYPESATMLHSSNESKLLLHKALDCATNEVVRYFLENRFCVDYLKMGTNMGELPLHLAAGRNMITPATTKIIMNAYPQALMVKDNSGCLPWQCCTSPTKMNLVLKGNPLLVLADGNPRILQRHPNPWMIEGALQELTFTANRTIDAFRVALKKVEFRMNMSSEVMDMIWAFLVPEVIGISFKVGEEEEEEVLEGQEQTKEKTQDKKNKAKRKRDW